MKRLLLSGAALIATPSLAQEAQDPHAGHDMSQMQGMDHSGHDMGGMNDQPADGAAMQGMDPEITRQQQGHGGAEKLNARVRWRWRLQT